MVTICHLVVHTMQQNLNPAVSLITFHALLLLYCPTTFILSSPNILMSQGFHIYSPNNLNASFSTPHHTSKVDYVNFVKWESYFPEFSSLNSSKWEANKGCLAWNLKGRGATDRFCSHSVDTKKQCQCCRSSHRCLLLGWIVLIAPSSSKASISFTNYELLLWLPLLLY